MLLEAIDKAGNAATAQTTLAVANDYLSIKPIMPRQSTLYYSQHYDLSVSRGNIAYSSKYLKVDGVATGLDYAPPSTGRRNIEVCAKNIFGEEACRGRNYLLVSSNFEITSYQPVREVIAHNVYQGTFLPKYKGIGTFTLNDPHAVISKVYVLKTSRGDIWSAGTDRLISCSFSKRNSTYGFNCNDGRNEGATYSLNALQIRVVNTAGVVKVKTIPFKSVGQ